MNSSALPHRYSHRLPRIVLAVVLTTAGVAAHATDRTLAAPHADPGAWATARVTHALTSTIDARVGRQIARTTAERLTRMADESVAPRSRVSMPAPSATASVEHTRLYLAIKDGAQSGVLVQ